MPDLPGLNKSPFKTLLLASFGGALEFYDFIIFIFLTAQIQTLFFSPDTPEWVRMTETFGIFAAGYFTRPVGGVVMAHFGDTRGRKRVFAFSILLMALPTLAIGLLPTYATIGVAAPLCLLLLRMLQGAAIGGEAPGGWVYVAEHARPNRVGLAVGLLTSGLCFGILLGSAVSLWINLTFTSAQVLAGAWRVPFLIGGVFGLLGMWLRNQLAETPVFLEIRRRAAAAAKAVPFVDVLRDHIVPIALSFAVTWMLTAAIVVVILMTPAMFTKLYMLPKGTVQIAGLVSAACLSVSTIGVGVAADRFGPRKVAVPAVCWLVAATYLLHIGAKSAPAYFILFDALAGIGAGAVVLAPIYMVRAFPPPLRFTGISFSYNIAYAISGGITPLLVVWLTGLTRFGPAHYVAAAAATGLLALMLPLRRTSATPGFPVIWPLNPPTSIAGVTSSDVEAG
jgi:MFS family permease